MNFGELYAELNRRVHGDVTNAAHLANLKQWINLARNQFCGFGPWHFLAETATPVALVTDQQEYSLATDTQHVNEKEIYLTTSMTRLYFLDDDELHFRVTDRTLTTTTSVGIIPKYFSLHGYQKLQLYPIPSAAAVAAETSFTYERFTQFTTDLSADGDLSGLPSYVEPAIIDLAEVHAQHYTRQHNLAQMAFGRFISAVQKLWQENSDILRLSPRDIPTPLKVEAYEQMTTAERS
jgi:hypothetical protein